jgi:hypothetical protein
MSSRLRAGVFTICCFGFALPAVAQLDSAALRAKFGPPLNRETFHLPSGFDLIVDYGPNRQVCKLEVPALMPTKENPANSSKMNQRMDEFLWDLVPDSMRGKYLNDDGMVFMSGNIRLESTNYEHVSISETRYADQPLQGTITVKFKNADCQRPTGQ